MRGYVDMSNALLVFLVSMSPVVELRGAIPLGIAKGMNLGQLLFFCLLGNLIPIIPLLVLFKWGVGRLEKVRIVGDLLHWWFGRVKKKSKVVETYGFWGLVLFVSIPFPGTGAWTGSVAATLFNFRLPKAFLAISLGVFIAGIFVTLASLGVVKAWFLFG